jgi:uncharacterized membrane protein
MSNKTVLTTAVAGVLALAGSAQAAGLVQCAEQERCYGVAKAGKNDCSTSSSACASSAKQDNQKDAWVYVPRGTCVKLAGGALTAPAPAKTK